MLKKTITYEDFNGVSHTEDFYFHLSKADLVDMMMDVEGDDPIETLGKMVAGSDKRAMMDIFKRLIKNSYGRKSEDGARFIKSPQMVEEFMSSPAYDEFFISLFQDENNAAEFIKGIVPKGLAQGVQDQLPVTKPAQHGPPFTPTVQDIQLPETISPPTTPIQPSAQTPPMSEEDLAKYQQWMAQNKIQ